MPIYKVTLNKFYGGVADDIISANASEYANAVGLDDLMQIGRLSPYRSYTARISGAFNIRRIVMGSDSTVYALGTVASGSTSSTTVFTKEFTAGINNASWTESISGNGAAAQSSKAFTEHGVDGIRKYLYMWDANGAIDRYLMHDSLFEDGWQNPSGANANNAGPIFAHSNGTIYFAYGNNVAGWDGTTFTVVAIDIPPGFQIMDLTEWNSYLIIAAAWGQSITSSIDPTKSRTFFWDTVNPSTYQFAKLIPEGIVYACQNIGGELVAITLQGGGTLSQDGRMSAYVYDGAQFNLKKKLVAREANNVASFAYRGQHIGVKNNQLYFIAQLGNDQGIWRFGKNNGVYCLKRDRSMGNTTASEGWEPISSNSAIDFIGDYLCATSDLSTTFCTINSNTYSSFGFYETPVFGSGKQYETKDLLSVAIVTRGLPASSSVLVRYRTDGNTSWTDIGTHSSGVFSEFADELPKGWNLIQFRLETTGNAEITELTALYESRLNRRL